MSFSFWLLGVESRDIYHAEKKRTACKAEQIQKMTSIFPQNDDLVSFCEFAWLCKHFFYEKNCVIKLPTAHDEHPRYLLKYKIVMLL